MKHSTPTDSNYSKTETLVVDEIQFNYFQFKSKIDTKDGKNDMHFTVHGRMKKDSIIWLSITPGLGVEAIRCIITRDSVLVIDRVNNRYYPYPISYISEQFNTTIDFFLLQNLILGNLPFPFSPNDDLISKNESAQLYHLIQKRENLQIESVISGITRKVENIKYTNTSRSRNFSATYSDFASLDSTVIAKKSILEFSTSQDMNDKQMTIYIEHVKTERTEKPLTFPFNVPKRFENKDNK
ncbi:MAG: DUF4292 domain-containing protein [Cytophagaceae bacterium]|nr:DUF4292 domain-containing protein [Cytophagaceae bacterium]MDW8456342.1 DUF4292 domain-containing protein [Cytophagaceae bacterium]